MKLVLFALGMMLSSLALAAPVGGHGDYCNDHGTLTQYVCDGYASGPGWHYDPRSGCYYRDTGYSCYNNPQPPYNPPNNPPPYGSWTRIQCNSWNYGYNECYLGGYVYSVTLERQLTGASCIPYQTFGASQDRMWVSNGCSGIFFVRFR